MFPKTAIGSLPELWQLLLRVTADNTEAYTLKPTWDKVANADFYEIDFMNMLYTTIKDTELLFGDLTPETPYSFKIRAVNKDGASAWTEFGAATKSDPLEFAIRGIRANVRPLRKEE